MLQEIARVPCRQEHRRTVPCPDWDLVHILNGYHDPGVKRRGHPVRRWAPTSPFMTRPRSSAPLISILIRTFEWSTHCFFPRQNA